DGSVRLWEVESGKPLWRCVDFPERVPTSALAFSHDGKTLVVGANWVGGQPAVLWLVNSATGRRHATLRHAGKAATSVSFLPDNKALLVSTSEGHVLLLRLADGKELLRLPHGDLATEVAIAPDGRRAASAGHYDRTIKVWDLETGRLLETLEGHMG